MLPKHTWQVPPLCSAYSLLVDRRAAHGGHSLCRQSETALGGCGISRSCVTHKLRLQLCRDVSIPWPCVFFILLSCQQLTKALWILPKQGCWRLQPKGACYLLQAPVVFKKCWIATTPSGYCLWFPPGSELSTLEEWSLPHRRLTVSQV